MSSTEVCTIRKRGQWSVNDKSKFLKVDISDKNLLKFSINQEKQLDLSLKFQTQTHTQLLADNYHALRIKRTQPKIMYGFGMFTYSYMVCHLYDPSIWFKNTRI